MSRRTDGVSGYIAGGLGNQLFILAAAWDQARRLDCPLYLDRSHFAVAGTHRYGLEAVSVPAIELAPRESWRSVRINSERVLPVPTKVGRVFIERTADAYMPSIEAIRPGTTLLGYFQSPRYFERVHADLLQAMWSTADTESETARIREMGERPAITLHLRRGDYLAVPTDRQFIASVDYAIRAIRLLRREGIDLPVRVFSDSVDLVKSELATAPGEFEFVEDDAALGTWATLKAMAAGKAMIMSNSSFSWWAAEMMQDRSEALVVAPRPWTLSGTAKADLLHPDWVTLDAR
ncbi:hypothetical protein J2Y46_001929 [Microbacterium sp. BE35]|uniref:alpha-1,2-fucosyltransferase n=1 Tax=Microbacterium sp. BE35 TaxID=2817773 RepID=UPI002855400C|nr:alpha-1,2-fucosyltransferase [Microbacterium sp. BE35]MDR7189106.1 hypothetical protein [Microbacterium sp. BE35]